jgi:hypothetical protein
MMYSYWAWTGVLYLLTLTYQDIFRHRIIDNRLNWFMLGMTYGLLAMIHHDLYYIISVALVGFGISWLMTKYGFGKGDAYSMMWCFVGWSFVGLQAGFLFVACIFLVVLVMRAYFYVTIRLRKLNMQNPVVLPFYPAFLAIFVLTFAIVYMMRL